MKKFSLKTQVIFICVLTIILVGTISNILLYSFLSDVISEKVSNIQQLTLSTVTSQLNWRIEELSLLGQTCSNDSAIAKVLDFSSLSTVYEKREGISARNAINNYHSSSKIEQYTQRIFAFNADRLMIQPASSLGYTRDIPKIMKLDAFTELSNSTASYIISISNSITTQKQQPSVAIIAKVFSPLNRKLVGWVYIELDLSVLEDVLVPYSEENFFIKKSEQLITPKEIISPTFLTTENPTGNTKIKTDGKIYSLMTQTLNIDNVFVCNYQDVSILLGNGFPIGYSLIVVVLTMLVTGIILAILLSSIVTKPIKKLVGKIEKISENDFSYDDQIEIGGGEIAEVGKVINEMTLSINHLLDETKDMYAEQQKANMALLQSQINPHFLYNTLDSIRWMASIQKAHGIEKMVVSLSSLLSNLAKGLDDKITLREELALLMDYVNIQNIRYMEMFMVEVKIPEEIKDCKIIKFTLQPLVENAIFHGLEPSDRLGEITISATEEDECIKIVVHDNGVGIEDDYINQINASKEAGDNFSGIGISNVDNRLKLYYGNKFGLSYKSEKDKYTAVTIIIPKEK